MYVYLPRRRRIRRLHRRQALDEVYEPKDSHRAHLESHPGQTQSAEKTPERGGTRVITEETQKGADAIKFRLEQPNAMYDGHDWWMFALKARSGRMARQAAAGKRADQH
jgi:hypothetical protein